MCKLFATFFFFFFDFFVVPIVLFLFTSMAWSETLHFNPCFSAHNIYWNINARIVRQRTKKEEQLLCSHAFIQWYYVFYFFFSLHWKASASLVTKTNMVKTNKHKPPTKWIHVYKTHTHWANEFANNLPKVIVSFLTLAMAIAMFIVLFFRYCFLSVSLVQKGPVVCVCDGDGGVLEPYLFEFFCTQILNLNFDILCARLQQVFYANGEVYAKHVWFMFMFLDLSLSLWVMFPNAP